MAYLYTVANSMAEHVYLSSFGSGPDYPDGYGGDYNLPHTMLCYECKVMDGIERKVLREGPVTNLRQDPTQTYLLECGHLAI